MKYAVATYLVIMNCLGCAHTVNPPDTIQSPFTYDEQEFQYLLTVRAFIEATGEDFTVEEINDIWGRILTIEWTKQNFECFGNLYKPGSMCAGQSGSFPDQPHFYWIIAAQNSCLPLTSYAHELLHILSWHKLGNWDAYHRDLRLFDPTYDIENHPEAAVYVANAYGVGYGLCKGWRGDEE